MALRLTEEEYAELLARQQQFQGEKYVGGRPESTIRRGHDDEAPEEIIATKSITKKVIVKEPINYNKWIFILLFCIFVAPFLLPIVLGIGLVAVGSGASMITIAINEPLQLLGGLIKGIYPMFRLYAPFAMMALVLYLIWINRDVIDRLWTRIGRQ